MNKIILTLLVGSLLFAPTRLPAKEDATTAPDLLALTTNFGPRRPSDASTNSPAAQPPPAAPAAPASAAPDELAPAPAPALTPQAEQAAREELIRRQEEQIVARQLIREGCDSYRQNKFEDAAAKLEQGLKILPRAAATDEDYRRATKCLGDSYFEIAEKAYKADDHVKARQFAQKTLEIMPNHSGAERLLVRLKQAELAQEHKEHAPAKTPPPVRPDTTPEFLAKREEVRKLFREGKILLNSGQYDEAEKRFKQILLIDHYNNDATELLAKLNQQRLDSAQFSADEARKLRLWQVADAWIPPIGREVQAPTKASGTGPISSSAGSTEEILKRLNTIVFPEVKFRETPISEVVTSLSDESRRLDPNNVGVNIVLGAGIGAAPATAAPAAAPAAPEAPAAAPAAAPGAPGPEAAAPAMPVAPAAPAAVAPGGTANVTLSLRNVPMLDALRYVTELAHCKYRVEPNAVLILPFDAPEGQMSTRSYQVSPGAFKTVITAPEGAPAGGLGAGAAAGGAGATTTLSAGPTMEAGGDAIKKIFIDGGVQFPAGSSMTYYDRTGTLLIRNTPENLETFERVLAAINVIPSQVEIEAKFVEISQTDLDELGFQWQLGSKDLGSFNVAGGNPTSQATPPLSTDPLSGYDVTSGNRDSYSLQGNAVDAFLAGQASTVNGAQVANQIATIRGIMTNPQFELVIKALSQKKSADVLSAPKVTTVSGAQAQIRVVQEFIYPSEYSEPTAGQNVITPSIPSGFKTREIGVLLNVTPTVGPDGYTINLTLIPEVSEFLGFLDYSPGNVSQQSQGINTTNVISQTIPFKIWQPLFQSRNVTTSIVIWDGQTIVLGGLIKENMQKIDDKVPFLGDIPLLGRLFQTKATLRSKSNLLIFVTARLIDPAGNAIHRQESSSAVR